MSILANDRTFNGKRPGASALLRSYAADLRGWAARLAAGYGVAAALLLGGILAVFGAIAVGASAAFHFIALQLGGILAVFGAIAVGASAAFHFIALHYGTNIAFAALGGGLLVLGAILLLAGWAMMKRRAPLPKPDRQFRAAKQMLVGSTVSRAIAAVRENDTARPDTTTQLLLGAAAILAVGWILATHSGSTMPASHVRPSQERR